MLRSRRPKILVINAFVGATLYLTIFLGIFLAEVLLGAPPADDPKAWFPASFAWAVNTLLLGGLLAMTTSQVILYTLYRRYRVQGALVICFLGLVGQAVVIPLSGALAAFTWSILIYAIPVVFAMVNYGAFALFHRSFQIPGKVRR